ncbi:MAG: helix-turn-helix domain-containing protein [Archaeoglobaceae archaeon]
MRKVTEYEKDKMFIRVTELAHLLGVHYVTIRNWIKQGKLPQTNKLSNRIAGWWVSDLPDWVQEKVTIIKTKKEV